VAHVTHSRDAFRRFYERSGARAGLTGVTRAQHVHGALLAATFDVEQAAANRRRASISVDGTPVVYSLQLTRGADRPAFRMLCEPGGLAIPVAEQIDFSRGVLRALTGRLGWRTAQAELDEILARVIPGDPAAMSNWWGGLWIGAAMLGEAAEIRVYVNLRHGEYLSRWQRIADLLAPFADQRLVPAVRQWMDTAGLVAIPVGVGAVLTAAGVPVVRVYLGVETPCMDAFRTARGRQSDESDAALAGFCAAFEACYGRFRRQSVTLGYDFAREGDGLFRPGISRFKVDVSFGHIAAGAEPSADAFIASRIDSAFPGGSASYRQFRTDLEECFGGSSIEYASLATRGERLSEMTVYARPGPACT
jgi:hypothetical protein